MISVRGFCDFNVRLGENKTSLKDTCQALLNLGYRAVAINSTFNGSAFDSKKKKKKGEVQEKGDMIPPPANQDIIREFEGKLEIFERLTVSLSTQLQAHQLSQSTNAKMYNILAVIPTTQVAFQYACSTMDVDLISFDPDDIGLVKCNRKMYNLAVERGLSFEIMYTPAIRDSTARKNVIQLAHFYHAFGKSKHIVISSGAASPFHVRGPYDVINLGLLFGLSEEQSKGAITTACRFLLIKAAGRRLGKTIVIANKAINMHNNSDKNEVENDELDEELEQPAQKKFRQDCSQDCVVDSS